MQYPPPDPNDVPPPEAPLPSPISGPGAWRFLAGFMSLGLLVGTSNGIGRVCLPLFAVSLHATALQVGLTGGLQFAGMLLLALPIGTWIDRYGSRPLFNIGTLGCAGVYLVALALVDAPWELILCVILLGLANPFRLVPTQTEFLHLLPQLGHAKAGWNRAAHTSGLYFIGPSLGAALIGWLGFMPTFQTVAAGLLVALLIGNRLFTGTPLAHANNDTAGLRQSLRGQVRLVLQHAELRRTMLTDACGNMSMAYFSVFIIILGTRQFGMTTQAAASLLALEGVTFVSTLFLAGSLLAGWPAQRRYALAFFLLLLHGALMWAPPTSIWLWPAAPLLGLGLGILHLTALGQYAQLMRELGRGRMGGLSSLSGPTGGLAGAVIGGLLAQHFGLLSGFRLIAVVFLLQWLWTLRAFKRGKRSDCA